MKLGNNDGKGDEFDWFDENPEDDPFMPKQTCSSCGGSGMYRNIDDIPVRCSRCYGTGVER